MKYWRVLFWGRLIKAESHEGESGGFLEYTVWLVYQRNWSQAYGLFLLKNICHRLCRLTKLINYNFLHILFTNGGFSFVCAWMHQESQPLLPTSQGLCLSSDRVQLWNLKSDCLEKSKYEKKTWESARKTAPAPSICFGCCVYMKIVAFAPCFTYWTTLLLYFWTVLNLLMLTFLACPWTCLVNVDSAGNHGTYEWR